jgi:hypothetical protein
MPSIRDVVQSCLGKSGNLSLRQDVFGVYGVNFNIAQRSLTSQLDLIQNKPFVRVVVVTIQGAASPNLQRDLDNANTVYQNECDAWIYCQDSISVNAPALVILNQNDCGGAVGHSVSQEEDALFDLGRNLGANIVGYYIIGSNGGFVGCAAHPPGRQGFWVSNISSSPWTFAHELTHVLLYEKVVDHVNDSDNLMFTPTARITNLPPNLTSSQSSDINNDPEMERC